MKTTKGEKMKAVLVTTEFRGVFYGEVKDDKKCPDEITLKNARNCIYWDSACGGFLGLAATGPTTGCRLGKKVDELKLYKITSIAPVTDEASKKWNL